MLIKTLILLLVFLSLTTVTFARERFFDIQSIDTMKYSRDMARSRMGDNSFDRVIETQIRNIAGTGATHVAVGTPYESEFVPYLRRWVAMARKYKLKVWFRGNLAGWEGWFDYPKIDEVVHTTNVRNFIFNHPDLFEDGDVFTSCPECENGGPGDPRNTGNVDGFRDFIISEYRTVKDTFKSLNKNVIANYYSMNGDVARLIMDKKTTKDLDGVVTLDHYVISPDKLEQDINDYARESGGSVVMGEFGVPIPDIHGDMSDKEQADWIDNALRKMLNTRSVRAVNYWTYNDSSTQLWNHDNQGREAVKVIEKYYNPINLAGTIKDDKDNPVTNVTISSGGKKTVFADGKYLLPILDGESVIFSKNGYISRNIKITANGQKDIVRDVIMTRSFPPAIYSIITKILNFFRDLFN